MTEYLFGYRLGHGLGYLGYRRGGDRNMVDPSFFWGGGGLKIGGIYGGTVKKSYFENTIKPLRYVDYLTVGRERPERVRSQAGGDGLQVQAERVREPCQ